MTLVFQDLKSLPVMFLVPYANVDGGRGLVGGND
jgi:hypothetical protein